MAIEAAVVTTDAIGCWRDIAPSIHVLALESSEGTRRADVDLFVAERKATGFEDTAISRNETIERGHGGIEAGATPVPDDGERLRERRAGLGLDTVAAADSRREPDATLEREARPLSHP